LLKNGTFIVLLVVVGGTVGVVVVDGVVAGVDGVVVVVGGVVGVVVFVFVVPVVEPVLEVVVVVVVPVPLAVVFVVDVELVFHQLLLCRLLASLTEGNPTRVTSSSNATTGNIISLILLCFLTFCFG
jgi:hypothetical protein